MRLATRLRRLALPAAAAALALGAAAPAAEARHPRCGSGVSMTGAGDFVGIVSEDVYMGDSAYRRCQLNVQARAGVGLHRQVFWWSDIERRRNRYDFSFYDEYVADMALHGMQVLPILINPPRFRSARPRTGALEGTYPPRNGKDMGRFAAKLIERYGPDGTLWDDRPYLPRVPIRSWQIWNEPNLRPYWPEGRTARAYAQLLRLTAPYIRRADPTAEIVAAGLPNSRSRGAIKLEKYVTDLYRARGDRYFDTLAIHPYQQRSSQTISLLRGIRRIMNRYRDRDTKVWVTELGWAAGGPRHLFNRGDRGQAREIGTILPALARRRRSLGIRGVVLYNWRDNRPYNQGRDFWGLHTGLFRLTGHPKPSYYSFVRAARRLKSVNPPGGTVGDGGTGAQPAR